MAAEPLRKSAPFDLCQWLSPAAYAAFLAAARRRRYLDGQTIYAEGEDGAEMFRIGAGSVRLSVTRSDGRELLFVLFEPGDCFGVSSVVDDGPRPHTAQAQGEVELLVWDRGALGRIRAVCTEIDAALLRLLAGQMRLVSHYFAGAHFAELSSRVAGRIVEAAQCLGRATAEGIGLTIPLPQAELAAMVGASRQRVNQVLQRFQQQGVINVKYGSLVVRDLDALRRRAAATP